jgi:putative PIN family toxin of toxin-antitoxin system
VVRIVVDPGVFVSGLVSRTGPPAQIVDLWLDGAFELVVSPGLLEELTNVIGRPKFVDLIPARTARRLVEELRESAILADDPPPVAGATPDPKDDYLVALAVACGEDMLVSGDRHLTGLRSTEPRVLTPRAFVDLLDR